jgi:hypothetical protein
MMPSEDKTMSAIKPYTNEADALEIGDLTIENRLDQVLIYGELQLTKDKQGLQQAKELKAIVDAVVKVLEAEKNLPERIAFKPTDEVDNPFK